MSDNRTVVIPFTVVLVVSALLLSSCLSLEPETYSDYVVPEDRADLRDNNQKPALEEPVDANNAAVSKLC